MVIVEERVADLLWYWPHMCSHFQVDKYALCQCLHLYLHHHYHPSYRHKPPLLSASFQGQGLLFQGKQHRQLHGDVDWSQLSCCILSSFYVSTFHLITWSQFCFFSGWGNIYSNNSFIWGVINYHCMFSMNIKKYSQLYSCEYYKISTAIIDLPCPLASAV